MIKLIAAWGVVVSVLILLQMFLDRRDKMEHIQEFPADNMYADTLNVCSIASVSGFNSKYPHLPRAFKVFIGQEEFAENCPAVSKFVFLQTPQQPVCDSLFAAKPLNVVQERWIVDTNKPNTAEDNEKELMLKSKNCEWVKSEFSNNFFVSAKEKFFPIAYAIVLNRAPNQVLRLLRVIYRPHNVYCLHYDLKSSHTTKQIIHNVASCLGNVIIPRKIEAVYWGWHTFSDAFFNCFSDLVLARDVFSWKYVITLCGMEVPLRTNAEIVAMLEPLNGTSSVKLVGADGLDNFKYKWKWSLNRMTGWITKKDAPLPPIPYGLKVYKSWAYVALSHQFVEYALCSPVARTFRDFMRAVRIPEENLFAMLYMQPGTPGGYREEHRDKIFSVISIIWLDGNHGGIIKRLYLMLFPETVCAGSNRHNICMVGARDLFRLSYRPGITQLDDVESNLIPLNERYYEGRDRGPIFHNKFILGRDKVVMQCMEQELARRNKLEYHKACSYN